MSIKLLISDLDGTFMADNFNAAAGNIELACSAADYGMEFAIATGRCLGDLSQELLSIKNLRYIILSNGAAVYDNMQKKYIFEDYIPNSEAYRIISSSQFQSGFIITFIDGIMHYQTNMVAAMQGYKMYREICDYIQTDCRGVENLAAEVLCRGCDIAKIVLMFKNYDNREQVVSGMPELMNYNIAYSFDLCMEVNKKGVSKGRAVKFLADKLGVSLEETAVAGDSGNDVSMLKLTPYSFVMENGMEVAKAVGKFRAPRANNGGFAYVFWKCAELNRRG